MFTKWLKKLLPPPVEVIGIHTDNQTVEEKPVDLPFLSDHAFWADINHVAYGAFNVTSDFNSITRLLRAMTVLYDAAVEKRRYELPTFVTYTRTYTATEFLRPCVSETFRKEFNSTLLKLHSWYSNSDKSAITSELREHALAYGFLLTECKRINQGVKALEHYYDRRHATAR